MEGHDDRKGSADDLWNVRQTDLGPGLAAGAHTAFPEELQRACAIDCEPSLGGGGEDAALGVEACVEDEDRVGRAD